MGGSCRQDPGGQLRNSQGKGKDDRPEETVDPTFNTQRSMFNTFNVRTEGGYAYADNGVWR